MSSGSFWERFLDLDKADQELTCLILVEKELKSNWGDESLRFWHAQKLTTIGRLKEAEAIYLDLLRSQVENSKLYLIRVALGEVFVERGEIQKAEKEFRYATECNPASTVSWVKLSECLFRQERFLEAIETLNLGLLASGDRDEVFLNLGHAKRATQDYAGAIESYKAALAINSGYDAARKALEDAQMACRESGSVKGNGGTL